MKRATVVGCKSTRHRLTGQDGSYLAELLLEKGYEVWGVLEDLQVSTPVELNIFLKTYIFVLLI